MVNFSSAVWAVGPIIQLGNSPRGGGKQPWRYKCWLLRCRTRNWGLRDGSQDCPQSLCPTGARAPCQRVGDDPCGGTQEAACTNHRALGILLLPWINMARDKLRECTFPELYRKHGLTDPLFILCILGQCGAGVLQISELFCWVFNGEKYFYGQGKESLVRPL